MHYTLWMLVGSLMFAIMGAAVKLASVTFTTAELTFYRGAISIVLIYFLARRQHISLKTSHFNMHAWRSFIGCVSLICSFYAIAHLYLATAVTLGYMSSLWIGVLMFAAALWRSISKHRIINIPLAYLGLLLLSFIGVLLLLRPTIGSGQIFAGLVGVANGFTGALAYMQVSALSRIGEPATRTVFYFSLGCLVCGAALMLVGAQVNWDWYSAIWLLPVGLFATLGQICLTKSYSLAKTRKQLLIVANLQYMGIVFSAILGYSIFHDRLDGAGILGIAIIIASGLLAGYIKTAKLT